MAVIFAIYDSSDSQNLIKQILKELNLDEKRFQPAGIASRISNAKNQLQSVSDFSKAASDFYNQKVAEIYERYQNKLLVNNAVDFDDLLVLSIRLLQESEEVRAKYQERFDYLLVDEYQDTNHAQYLLTKLLAARHRNICVVAMPTRAFTAGAVLISKTFWILKRIIPKPKSSSWNRITAVRRLFWMLRMLLLKIIQAANLKICGRIMIMVWRSLIFRLSTNATRPVL